MSRPLNITLNEKNHDFLNELRHEIIMENAVNIPLSRLMEMSLIELRKNNSKQEIKEKMVHYKRLNKDEMNGMICNLGD